MIAILIAAIIGFYAGAWFVGAPIGGPDRLDISPALRRRPR